MNKKAEFTPHIIAISALFVSGNGILSLPEKGADGFTFLAFLVSLPLVFLIFWLSSIIFGKISETKSSSGGLKKAVYIICLISAGIFALFSGAATFKALTEFVSAVMLPETPMFFIVAVLLVAVIYFFIQKEKSILKFGLISGVLTATAVVFFFVSAADRYDLRNIFIFRLPSFRELIFQLKPYLINPVLQVAVLPVFLKGVLRENKLKSGFFGVLVGGIFLGLGILSSVLLFSPEIAGVLQFPFSSAVSTVTVGRLFTRLDGFAYFVYFVCGLSKITVCVFSVRWILRELSIIIRNR